MTSHQLTRGVSGPTTLSQLDGAARYERFDVLQARMARVWDSMRLNIEGESVVIVPSVSLDRAVERTGSLTQAYEERYLFLLLLLRQPQLRMTYVTSMPVAPTIIEYYLALLAGVIPSHARSRLSMISVGDSSPTPLSEKLLARPKLLAAIASSIPDQSLSHLLPYNTTELERDVALALGIPMYGSDPRLEDLGSKTGCRRMFAAAGIRHPAGCRGSAQRGRCRRRDRGHASRAAEHDAGHRQAERRGVGRGERPRRSVRDVPRQGHQTSATRFAARVNAMQLEAHRCPASGYLDKFAQGGGIVEERILGVEVRSPSVQLRVTPHGDVELLSTHDQLLGGASGQTYLGCRFPADFGVCTVDHRAGQDHRGAAGDRGCSRPFRGGLRRHAGRDGSWTPYAIELNLRKGGTTHPFLTLQFLTAGAYDADTGLFGRRWGGRSTWSRPIISSRPSLRGFTIDDLFDIVARHGLHFEPGRQTGVVFHMISCLTEHGRVGLTAVGDTPDEARRHLQTGGADPAGRSRCGAA